MTSVPPEPEAGLPRSIVASSAAAQLSRPRSPLPGMPLQAYLTRLIWLVMLPLAVAAMALAWDHVRDVQDRIDNEARNLADGAARAVDRALNSRMRGLGMVAESPYAARSDQLGELYALAQSYVRAYESQLVVADAGLKMLVNTRVPLGTPLPSVPRPEGRAAAPEALRTGKPAIGDLFIGPVVRQPMVAVAIPVRQADRTRGVVVGTLDATFFTPHLRVNQLPERWHVTLRDSTGATIASTRNADTPPGPVVQYRSPSTLSGWTVAVEVPTREAQTTVREAAAVVALALLLSAGAGVLGGHLAGRRLERAVGSLAHGGPPPADAAQLREVAEVRRRLDDAAEARSRAEAELRERERSYRLLFDAHPHPLWVCDPASGRILAVNDAAVAAYRWSREAFLALHTSDLRPAADAAAAPTDGAGPAITMEAPTAESVSADAAAPPGAPRSVVHVCQDGSRRDVELSSSQLDWQGQPARLELAVDVTERNELVRQRLAALNDALAARNGLNETLARIGDGVVGLDRELRFTYLNRQAAAAMGVASPEEMLGHALTERYPDAAPDHPVIGALMKALNTGESSIVEHPSTRVPGLWYETRVYPSADGVSAYFNDITERRRAAEALRASEKRYRDLFEANPTPAWVVDRQTLRFLAVNDAAVAHYGHTREAFLTMTLRDVLADGGIRLTATPPAPDADPDVPPALSSPGWHRTGDGRLLEVEMASNALVFEGQDALLMLATDVTERHAAQREREAADRRFREMMERVGEGFFALDRQLRFTYLNDRALASFGYARLDEAIGQSLWDRNQLGPDHPARLAVEESQRSGISTVVVHQSRTSDTWYESRLYPSADGMSVYFTDITARRRLEGERDQALAQVQASEARFRALFEHSMDMLYIGTPDGRIEAANPAACRALGLTEDEIRHQPETAFVDLSREAARAVRERRDAEGFVHVETIMVRSDGTRFPVEATAVSFRDALGNRWLGGIARDISARRKAEAALAAQRAQLDAALSNMLDAVYITDQDGRFVKVNAAFRDLFPFATDLDEDHLASSIRERIDVLDSDGRRLPFAAWPTPSALRGEGRRDVTLIIRRKDTGASFYGSFTSSPIRDADGQIVGAVITARDVTRRIEDERALRASERDFRVLAEQIPAIVYRARLDPPGHTEYVSPRISELGYTPEEWVSRPGLLWELIHPDDRDAVQAQYTRALASGQDTLHLAYRMRNAAGGWRHVADHSQVIRPADGGAPFLLGVNVDVSEVHDAEQALRAKEQRFQSLAEQMPAVIYRSGVAPPYTVHYVSPYIGSLGYTAEQWRSEAGPTWRTVLHPEDLPRVTALLAGMHARGEEVVLEFRLRDAWGRWRDFIDHASIVEGEADEGLVFQGVMIEITQLKRSEQALREAEAYQRSLFEMQADGVLLLDASCHVLDANPAARQMMGRAHKQLLGHDLRELVAEHDRARVDAALAGLHPSAVGTGNAAASTPVPQLAEWEHIRPDGSTFPAEVNLRAGSAGRLVAVVRDVTERRAAQQALLAYQRELSELTRRLLVQERETTRHLAQTLHDHVGQSLAVARLRLDAAAATLGEAMQPPMKQACLQVGSALDHAITDVRDVLGDLRPPMLEDQGLLAALDNEIRTRTRAQGSVDVLLEVDDGRLDARWPADVEYAAFMIAREAIVNAQLHAGASLVRVIVIGGGRELTLAVVDDGHGIPELLRTGRPGHLGLVGMRERALAIGAHFAVEQPPEGGTRIVLCWPGVRP